MGINRRDWLAATGACLASPRSREDPGNGGSSIPDRLRNVLVIVGDDHAAHALGCYGNPIARTPNLDRLARQGIRMDRAFANSPVCTPSRQSLLTGLYPHRVGVTLLETALAESTVTLADRLSARGYRTAAIGKMHFNSRLRHGFEEHLDLPDYREQLRRRPPRRPPAGLPVRPPWKPFQDPARVWLNAEVRCGGLYEQDMDGRFFVEKARDFLRAQKEQPFCLWVGFNQPHSPLDFPVEWSGRFRPQDMPLPKVGPEDARWIPRVFRDLTDADRRGITAAYHTASAYLDFCVGEILGELHRLGLDRSTLVVYLGDNGYQLGHHGRFEKHTMWEEAVRVPLILRDPMAKKRAQVVSEPVELADVVPTILDLLGQPPLPEQHGRSLAPLWRGGAWQPRDFVFSEFLPDNLVMARTREWKYTFTGGRHDLAMGYATGEGPSGPFHRLYDLREDPREFRNRAADPSCRAIREELQGRLLDLFRRTDPRASALSKDLPPEEQLARFSEPPERK